VLTLLRLDQRGAQVKCFAPNIAQHHVINHLTGEEMPESRNVLVESARIARGAIEDIREADITEFDALIIPGGFGAAKNLSNFAIEGTGCTVQPEVLALTEAFAEAGKPVGLICISPALAAKIYGPGVVCTIGNDADTVAAMNKMGATHKECAVSDIVEDKARKLVTHACVHVGAIDQRGGVGHQQTGRPRARADPRKRCLTQTNVGARLLAIAD
jgi:enhancing lycopene biosynthesis protein 2